MIDCTLHTDVCMIYRVQWIPQHTHHVLHSTILHHLGVSSFPTHHLAESIDGAAARTHSPKPTANFYVALMD